MWPNLAQRELTPGHLLKLSRKRVSISAGVTKLVSPEPGAAGAHPVTKNGEALWDESQFKESRNEIVTVLTPALVCLDPAIPELHLILEPLWIFWFLLLLLNIALFICSVLTLVWVDFSCLHPKKNLGNKKYLPSLSLEACGIWESERPILEMVAGEAVFCPRKQRLSKSWKIGTC